MDESEGSTNESLCRDDVTVHGKPRPPLLKQKCISVISQDSYGSIVINYAVTPNASEINIDSDDVNGSRAPDGGYGWIILVAAALSFCINGFMFGSFPVMYVALVERYDADRGVTGWIGSMYGCTGQLFGIVIGAYVKKYGCRIVAIIGALFGTTGIALSAIDVNIPYLYLTYGVLGGFGCAMSMIPNIVILQQYFNKKRTMALGVGTAGMSAGAMVAAPIVSCLLRNYGISGTYLFASGIWLQNLVFASLYRPVCGVANEVPSSQEESQDTTTEANTISKSNVDTLSQKDISPADSGSNKDNTHILRETIDCTPLKNSKLCIYIAANFLFHLGAMTFFSHYLSRLTFIGLEQRLCIILQTTMEGATFVSRIGCSLICNIKGVNTMIFMAVTVTLGGLVVFSFSLVHTPVLLAVFGILHGITAGGYLTLQFSLLVDVSGVETIAKTTGILSMTLATSVLLGIPLAGFVFDVTGSYDYPFMVNGSIHIVGGILLIVLAVLHLR